MNNNSWQTIFDKYQIQHHNFDNEPFIISAEMIKQATAHFTRTNEKEVRILCKQDSREKTNRKFLLTTNCSCCPHEMANMQL
jgi:histidine ammonia-lyase